MSITQLPCPKCGSRNVIMFSVGGGAGTMIDRIKLEMIMSSHTLNEVIARILGIEIIGTAPTEADPETGEVCVDFNADEKGKYYAGSHMVFVKDPGNCHCEHFKLFPEDGMDLPRMYGHTQYCLSVLPDFENEAGWVEWLATHFGVSCSYDRSSGIWTSSCAYKRSAFTRVDNFFSIPDNEVHHALQLVDADQSIFAQDSSRSRSILLAIAGISFSVSAKSKLDFSQKIEEIRSENTKALSELRDCRVD